MRCSRCQSPNPKGERFCGDCGTALEAGGEPLYAQALYESLPAGSLGVEGAASAKRPRVFAGHAALAGGDLREAAARFEKTARHFTARKHPRPAIVPLGFLALAYSALGEFARAADAFAEAERYSDSERAQAERAVLLLCRGHGRILHADWSAAVEILERQTSLASDQKQMLAAGIGRILLAWAQGISGAEGDPRRLAQEGYALMNGFGPQAGRSFWIAAYAEALRVNGAPKAARTAAGEALGLAERGDRWGEILAARTLGALLSESPDGAGGDEALELLERAEALAIERGARPELAVTRLHLADLLFRAGEIDAARPQLDQASWLSLGLEMPWLTERATALRAKLPPPIRPIDIPPVPKGTVP